MAEQREMPGGRVPDMELRGMTTLQLLQFLAIIVQNRRYQDEVEFARRDIEDGKVGKEVWAPAKRQNLTEFITEQDMLPNLPLPMSLGSNPKPYLGANVIKELTTVAPWFYPGGDRNSPFHPIPGTRGEEIAAMRGLIRQKIVENLRFFQPEMFPPGKNGPNGLPTQTQGNNMNSLFTTSGIGSAYYSSKGTYNANGTKLLREGPQTFDLRRAAVIELFRLPATQGPNEPPARTVTRGSFAQSKPFNPDSAQKNIADSSGPLPANLALWLKKILGNKVDGQPVTSGPAMAASTAKNFVGRVARALGENSQDVARQKKIILASAPRTILKGRPPINTPDSPNGLAASPNLHRAFLEALGTTREAEGISYARDGSLTASTLEQLDALWMLSSTESVGGLLGGFDINKPEILNPDPTDSKKTKRSWVADETVGIGSGATVRPVSDKNMPRVDAPAGILTRWVFDKLWIQYIASGAGENGAVTYASSKSTREVVSQAAGIYGMNHKTISAINPARPMSMAKFAKNVKERRYTMAALKQACTRIFPADGPMNQIAQASALHTTVESLILEWILQTFGPLADQGGEANAGAIAVVARSLGLQGNAVSRSGIITKMNSLYGQKTRGLENLCSAGRDGKPSKLGKNTVNTRDMKRIAKTSIAAGAEISTYAEGCSALGDAPESGVNAVLSRDRETQEETSPGSSSRRPASSSRRSGGRSSSRRTVVGRGDYTSNMAQMTPGSAAILAMMGSSGRAVSPSGKAGAPNVPVTTSPFSGPAVDDSAALQRGSTGDRSRSPSPVNRRSSGRRSGSTSPFERSPTSINTVVGNRGSRGSPDAGFDPFSDSPFGN